MVSVVVFRVKRDLSLYSSVQIFQMQEVILFDKAVEAKDFLSNEGFVLQYGHWEKEVNKEVMYLALIPKAITKEEFYDFRSDKFSAPIYTGHCE